MRTIVVEEAADRKCPQNFQAALTRSPWQSAGCWLPASHARPEPWVAKSTYRLAPA